MEKTLGEMLIGRKVMATQDCRGGAENGKIYVIKNDEGALYLGGSNCDCVSTWIPIDFEIIKVEHKHTFTTKCECGEEKKD